MRPGAPPNTTLSQGGTGATLAVAGLAGLTDGPHVYVLKQGPALAIPLPRETLHAYSWKSGLASLNVYITALARGAGSVIIGVRTSELVNAAPSITRVVDGTATASNTVDVSGTFSSGTLGPVAAIATASGAMIWAQGETTPPGLGCAPGYTHATYQIRTRALPDGQTGATPQVAADFVKGTPDCRPPPLAMDACNLYWAEGDRIMARGR